MTFKKNTNSLADMAVSQKLAGVDSFLLHIDKIIDFTKLLPILKKNGIGSTNAAGNVAYNNISMFKVILVQKFYGLSDANMEEGLKTNLLFMKFTGFGIEDDTPDHTTINRFRNSLIRNNLYDKLFDAVNQQLTNRGFIAKEGKIILVDATLIESKNTSILNKTKEALSGEKNTKNL